MFFSSKEERNLIGEIMIVMLFLIIIIPMCVSASNKYNNREAYSTKTTNIYADLTENLNKDSDNKVISNKIVTIGSNSDSNVKVNITFKIKKYNNSYNLILDDKTYELSKLEYVEDSGYLYYNLGSYNIDKESKMNFKLVMNNDISLDDSVSYSFLVEGI